MSDVNDRQRSKSKRRREINSKRKNTLEMRAYRENNGHFIPHRSSHHRQTAHRKFPPIDESLRLYFPIYRSEYSLLLFNIMKFTLEFSLDPLDSLVNTRNGKRFRTGKK